MKQPLIITVTALLLASLACSFIPGVPGSRATPSAAVGAATATARARLAGLATPARADTPVGVATAVGASTAASATAAATSAVSGAATAAPTAAATVASQAQPFTLDNAAEAQAAMLPQFADDVTQLPNASRYVIDVTITFDSAAGTATLAGHELIRYTNSYTLPLGSLMLMLWPNDSDQYLGKLTLGAVTVGGAAVQPVMESRGLAARLPLAKPLAPGQRVDLTADFTTRADPGVENGARFGLSNGVLLAPTFYPIIPRIVDGQWQSEWPVSLGDVSNSDTAFYALRITAPARLDNGQKVSIAASGVVVGQSQSGDTQTESLLTGPMRDVALAVGDLHSAQHTLPNGVRVNAWALPEHAAQAQTLADEGAAQLDNLDNLVGPYPFAELDIVDAPGAYGGVEYPGLVYIGVVDADNHFEEATVHEVGHQWFYSVIGDDQLLQPWLDEAAASYTEVLYTEKAHGAAAAQRYMAYFQNEADGASDPNQAIGLPVSSYDNLDDYSAIVYAKGAVFFDTLRHQLGDTVFFKFLHAYYQQYKYGFATSADFEQSAEGACGCDLKPLFQKWVYGNQ